MVAFGSLAAFLAAVSIVVGAASDSGARPPRPPAEAAGETTGRTTEEDEREDRGSAARSFSLIWVGDLTPGSRYGVPPEGGRPQLAPVRKRLRDADLTLGNLEGTYSTGGASKCGGADSSTCFAFQAPPGNAAALREAGFDLMNLANNHAFDFGADGQGQTVKALRKAGVKYTGRPGEITVVRARGGAKVAVVGFASYDWAAPIGELDQVRELVRAAAKQAPVVVATMHAGAEGPDKTHTPEGRELAFGEDRGDTRGFAHAAIDAGADLVLGSGPHVIRGVERYKGRLIAYSLGNFAGWENFGMGGALSLSGMVHVVLRPDGRPLKGTWIPLRLTGPGIPTPDPAGESTKLAASLSAEDFGDRAALSADGRIRARP